MPLHPHVYAARFEGALLVEHCDIPEHMTLWEWRAKTAADSRPSAAGKRERRGLRRRLGRAA